MTRKACTLISLALICSAAHAEIITVRSGQSAGVPGTPGSTDDLVRYNPWGNPPGGPVAGSAFAAADFAATAGGPMATVITPHPAWMGSGAVAPLSDPLARWINFGVTSGNYGAPGSALYAVPFWVTSSNITSATLTMEGGVDDFLGDWFSGGANPIGCYVNGTPFSAFSVFNYSAPTSATQDITSAVTPGLNYLYLYQRDGGVLVSGLIFSGTIEIVPAPGSMALIFFGGLLTSRRRRD